MSFGETEPSQISGAGHFASAAPGNRVTFERRELHRILVLDGRKVAAGEWRDYAIDFLKDRAVFSVFRRSSEMPIYRIEKNPKLARRQGAYSVVSATGLIVRRGHELHRALRSIDKLWSFGCGLIQSYRFRRRARPQRALHQHAVEPAAALEADVLDGADHAKAGGAVQPHRDHLR